MCLYANEIELKHLLKDMYVYKITLCIPTHFIRAFINYIIHIHASILVPNIFYKNIHATNFNSNVFYIRAQYKHNAEHEEHSRKIFGISKSIIGKYVFEHDNLGLVL